jgi:hypothetical protein
VNLAAGQRFWSKVDTSAGRDGCWPWLAARARGYGRFLWNGKVRQAHQVAYELATGEPHGALNVGQLATTMHVVTRRTCAPRQRNNRTRTAQARNGTAAPA